MKNICILLVIAVIVVAAEPIKDIVSMEVCGLGPKLKN
jgi:hypothetical protein